MAIVASGELAVTPDLKGFESQIGGSFKRIAGTAAAAFGGIFAAQQGVEFFTSAIDGASDLQESLGKVGVVFGPMAADIEKFASNSAKSIGQSKQQALEAAGTFGNLAVSLGLPQKQAADMSTSLVTLGADLASFNNTTVDEALNALRSGLTGETEPLKRFGIALDDASLKQKALELGLVKSTKGVLPPAIKAQASYALIMEQSTKSQGDFARTSGGLANQQRIFAAQIVDLKTKIGAALLPVVSKLAGFLINNMIPAFESIGKTLKPVIQIVKDVVAAFQVGDDFGFPENKAFAFGKAMRDVFDNVIKPFATFVQNNFKPILIGLAAAALLLAGPVVAVGAAFVLAYTKSEAFRDIVTGVITKVSAIVGSLVTFVQANMPKFQETFERVANAVTAVFDQFKGTFATILNSMAFIFTTAFSAVINAVKQFVLFFSNLINGDFAAAWKNLGNISKIGSDALFAILKNIVPTMFTIFKNVGAALFSLGADIVLGLIRGILSKAGDVIAAIKKSITDKIPDFVKRALGMDSPSKVFAAFGRNMMEGLAVGISGNAGSPLGALASVNEQLGGPMASGGAGGGGAAGGHVFNVSVNFAGAMPTDAQAYQVGQAVGRGAAYEMERADARRAARVA